MKKLEAIRAAVAAAAISAATSALAAGDSGTSSMGEMSVSGAQFGMLIGGLVGLGVVIWVVSKFVSK